MNTTGLQVQIRVLLRVFVVVITAMLTWQMTTVPAWAHVQLIRSTPAAGGVITEVPTEVRLTFSDSVRADSVQVAVSRASGGPSIVDFKSNRADGATVVQPLPGSTSSGDYVLAYRLVSSDGHSISGTLAFAVRASPSQPSAAAATPAPSPSASVPAPAEAREIDTVAASMPYSRWWLWLVAAAGVAAVAGLLAVVSRRRRHSGPST